MNFTRRLIGSLRRGSLRSDLAGRLASWRLDHRRLAANPAQAITTHSSVRVNSFSDSLVSPTSYLEIGVEHGYTLEAVKLSKRVGVDPHPLFSVRSLPPGLTVHPVTSDGYFETLGDDVQFDVVFLDGLHTFRQTYRDLINSLRHLEPSGVIIIDDVVPSDETSAMPDLDASISARIKRGESDFKWHGDVYRVIPLLRDHHPELQFRTVVGLGNEQTVLWKRYAHQASVAVDDATLEEYGDISYETTFADGIPEYFKPGSDTEVLQDFQRRTRLRPAELPRVDEPPT